MRSAVLFLMFLLISCNKDIKQEPSNNNKTIEMNIALYQSYQNGIRDNDLDSLLTETYKRYMNGIEMVSNINELKAGMEIFKTGFPDMDLSYPDQIIKENNAFINWVMTGTNTGVFGDVAATGKKVKISGITHLYFNETGKIYREDVFFNELDLLQQLGYTLNKPTTE